MVPVVSCWRTFVRLRTGLAVPFMGHRLIRIGGKGAVEYLIKTAFWVAVAFVVSDYDGIQKFLVFGSESEVRCLILDKYRWIHVIRMSLMSCIQSDFLSFFNLRISHVPVFSSVIKIPSISRSVFGGPSHS